jgi:hypothetical protein
MGSVLTNCNGQRSNQHQKGLNITHQAKFTEISAKTNWTKLMLVGKASSILQDSTECALHIRREVKLDT